MSVSPEINGSPLVREITAMDDMDLVPIGITQIGAEITVAIMRAWAWTTFVGSTMSQTASIGLVHRPFRWREKGDHATVASRRRLAIEGAIDVKTRQWGVHRHPAKCHRSAIGGDGPAYQAKRREHGIIETSRPLKIIRSDGYVAEHLNLDAPAIWLSPVAKCGFHSAPS
ncbi:Predicted protein (fragment) [Agrobacterium fabrum str. J-07]